MNNNNTKETNKNFHTSYVNYMNVVENKVNNIEEIKNYIYYS